jgi:hypothetical protein
VPLPQGVAVPSDENDDDEAAAPNAPETWNEMGLQLLQNVG